MDQPTIEDQTGRKVVLFRSPYKESEYLRNVRCINCGKLVFKYDYKIELIVDSNDFPLGKGKSEHLCTRCNLTYLVV